jgi:hypothetical protein
MRSVSCMIYETSLLDPEEGIRFRGCVPCAASAILCRNLRWNIAVAGQVHHPRAPGEASVCP